MVPQPHENARFSFKNPSFRGYATGKAGFCGSDMLRLTCSDSGAFCMSDGFILDFSALDAHLPVNRKRAA
jgi:hypothetical protein